MQLYGQKTSDKYRPSVLKRVKDSGITEEALAEDKVYAECLKSTKIRDAVICAECDKPRCIYAMNRLTLDQVS